MAVFPSTSEGTPLLMKNVEYLDYYETEKFEINSGDVCIAWPRKCKYQTFFSIQLYHFYFRNSWILLYIEKNQMFPQRYNLTVNPLRFLIY